MASEAGPVSIVVDIVDQFSDELEELETKLKALDSESIDVEFNIDDVEEEIEKVQAQIKKLEKRLDATLDIDVSGEKKAQAIKALLSRDMRSTLHIDTDRGFGSVPPPDLIDDISQGSINRAVPDADMFHRDFDAQTLRGLVSPDSEYMKTLRMMQPRSPDIPGVIPDFDTRSGLPGADLEMAQLMKGGRAPKPSDFLSGPRALRGIDLETFNRRANKQVKSLVQTVDRFRPNIMMIWNALAALIPIMVSLGAAAIGLAGGLIAVATAGAAVLGLGLLGWGENFQQSMQEIQKRARALGRQLFDVLQPVADVAQPVMQDWLEGAPRQVQKLVGPLSDLIEAFDDPLGRMGGGVVDWLAAVVERMTSMRDIIVQITSRFGRVAGNFLIEFMTNMVEFAYRNQTQLIEMARALRLLLRLLLKFSIFIVRVLAPLKTLLEVVAPIADLFLNRWVAGLVAAATSTILLVGAVSSLTAASSTLSGGIIASVITSIGAYIGAVWSAITATYQWLVAIGTLKGALLGVGIGLASIGAGVIAARSFGGTSGPPPGAAGSRSMGGGARGGGGGTTIVVQGDMRKRELDRVLDKSSSNARQEDDVSSSRSFP